MKWVMWWAHVGLTGLVIGGLLDASGWSGWRAWAVWIAVFAVTAWWEYIVVMSWEHWTAIEAEDREREKREREQGQ